MTLAPSAGPSATSSGGGGGGAADDGASFPELLGKPWQEAEAAIRASHPALRVIPLGQNSPVTRDYRLDRVRVFYDEEGKVSSVPRTG